MTNMIRLEERDRQSTCLALRAFDFNNACAGVGDQKSEEGRVIRASWPGLSRPSRSNWL